MRTTFFRQTHFNTRSTRSGPPTFFATEKLHETSHE
ncbi:hypothetical protein VTO58DRAFT_102855 [Aureobasidium pullulans]